MKQTAHWILLCNAAFFLLILALGMAAFKRRWQVLSLSIAKHLLMFACALEVIIQGMMTV